MDAAFQLERRVFGPETATLAGVALVLVESGALFTVLEPDEPTRLVDGDLLLLGSSQSAGLSARRGGAVGSVFRAQGEWLARALALAGFALESAPLRAATLRAGTHEARRAARCLRELAALLGEPSPDARLASAARAFDLLGIALAARSSAQSEVPRARRSAARSALADALDALARDPRAGLSLAHLAARLGVSERQASRLVQERLGSSLGDHVAELRVACAKRLLLESDLAVIDVAGEAGFGSLGHFNQVFRSRSGCTPSAFRSGARQRSEAQPPAALQPPVTGGAAIVADGAGVRGARASLRSSCFTIESTQAQRGTLPS